MAKWVARQFARGNRVRLKKTTRYGTVLEVETSHYGGKIIGYQVLLDDDKDAVRIGVDQVMPADISLAVEQAEEPEPIAVAPLVTEPPRPARPERPLQEMLAELERLLGDGATWSISGDTDARHPFTDWGDCVELRIWTTDDADAEPQITVYGKTALDAVARGLNRLKADREPAPTPLERLMSHPEFPGQRFA